jgi:hypothetical protein
LSRTAEPFITHLNRLESQPSGPPSFVGNVLVLSGTGGVNFSPITLLTARRTQKVIETKNTKDNDFDSDLIIFSSFTMRQKVAFRMLNEA